MNPKRRIEELRLALKKAKTAEEQADIQEKLEKAQREAAKPVHTPRPELEVKEHEKEE